MSYAMRRSLSGHRDFRVLRNGQFVGDLGGSFSGIAIPATVILALNATATQVGLLDAVASATIPLVASFAGLAVDRMRRRPLMIAANIVRLLALLALPLSFLLGHPPLWLFFVVAFTVAIASVVFDTAYAALLPQIVGTERVREGNAKLAMANSLAEAAGQGTAGALVAAVGAPFVVLVNVTTYAFSTVALLRLRVDEQPPAPPPPGSSILDQLREGAAAIVMHPLLRRVTAANAVAHLGGGIATAVSTVFLYRELHLSPAAFGLAMGCANAGLFAACYADRVAERLGTTRTLALANLTSGGAKLVLPLFAAVFPFGALICSRLMVTVAGPMFAVNDASLRAEHVPDALLGRATATARTIVWIALPLGSLVGGILGDHLGLRATMLVGGMVTASAALILLAPACVPSRTFLSGGMRALRREAPGH